LKSEAHNDGNYTGGPQVCNKISNTLHVHFYCITHVSGFREELIFKSRMKVAC